MRPVGLRRRHLRIQVIQERSAAGVGSQEGFNVPSQRRIGAARLFEVGGLLVGFELAGDQEDLREPVVAVRVHACSCSDQPEIAARGAKQTDMMARTWEGMTIPASDETTPAVEQASAEELLPLVYQQLRELAGRHLRRERPGHTLQPTALVHQAYLKIGRSQRFKSKTHFIAIAARAVRQVLVDHAIRRRTKKRGGDWKRVTVHEGELAGPTATGIDVEALDDALKELEERDPRQSQVVVLRFFGGLTVPDTAEVLGVSEKTVKNDWRFARAWLLQRLDSEEP